MITYIRSNDCIRGFTFDAPWFMLLMQCMKSDLQYYYPELELGKYIHFAGSLHLYEEHFSLVEKMLQNPFNPQELPRIDTLFDYKNPFNTNDSFFKWILENKTI